jgi:trimeric autotransporter adhesin
LGTISGALSIQHSGVGSPQIVNMSGVGISALSFSPSPLVFPPQIVGTTNKNMTLSIGNGSGYPNSIDLTSITVQGADFQLGENPCPPSLARFMGCAVQITFKPKATGPRAGTVTIVASDSSQPHIVQVQGPGIGTGRGMPSVTSLSFSVQKVGTTSAAQQVQLTNSGKGILHLGQIGASPGFFLVSNNCGTSLAAAGSCAISVKFSPTVAGILAGTLTINDDGANAPHLVSLTGIGQ